MTASSHASRVRRAVLALSLAYAGGLALTLGLAPPATAAAAVAVAGVLAFGALLMIDVDHFKRYNDRHGHAAGDACLGRIAALLRDAVQRPSDLVARYGGEEFVVMLPGTDLAGAQRVARRCLEAADRAALPHGDSPSAAHVTLSIGLAVGLPGQHAADPSETLRRADEALYQAKQSGRHCFRALLAPGAGAGVDPRADSPAAKESGA